MEGGHHQVRGLRRRRRPATQRVPNLPSTQIQYAGDVQVAFIGCHRRNIAHPPRIRRHNVELAVQEIRSHLVPARPDAPCVPASAARPLRLELPQP